ncbi:hypothetical protein [Undibacterium sp. SXout20W]|uniref:hypothetical protein n=1 Tax=Undibacterium sp. SXout20W TaxID=3413051 RepID=UPI003BF1D622
MRDNPIDSTAKNAKNLIFGLFLVATGCLILIYGWDDFVLMATMKWWYFVPALIAVYGLIDIALGRTARRIGKGCFKIIFSFWLFASMEHLWGWTFRTSWPLILIAIGVQSIVSGLLASKQES